MRTLTRRNHLQVVADDDSTTTEVDCIQPWEVVGKLEKRYRRFTVVARNADEATEVAIQLIEDYHGHCSGKFGNEVWRSGSIKIVAQDGTTQTVR